MYKFEQKFFRNAEGEGTGGAAEQSAEGASPVPDKISALESRLDRMAAAFEGNQAETKQRSTQNAIMGRDRELNGAKDAAVAAVSSAETALADAYDNGEGAEIAKAQRILTEAVAKRERADIAVEDFRTQVKAAERKQPAGNLDDQNLNSWKSKHASWYGVDAEMTKASHAIDRQIRDAGVISVGSKAYFDAVDKQMSAKYPDKFGGTPMTNGGNGGGGAAPVSSSRGRIQQSIADGWRRMGINMDDPKTVERMVKNRQSAVDKGILSSEPVTGRIITR